MNVAYLKTEIKDTQSIDPRDISNGNPNVTVLKDVINGSNYAIPTAALGAARGSGCVLPGSFFGLFSNAACAPFAGAFGINDGVAVDLDGNLENGGFAVFAVASYDRLLGDAADSPTTSVRGSPNQFLGAVGIGYTF